MRRAIVGLVLAAATAASGAPASAAPLRWAPCAAPTPKGFQCATLHVPADPAKPTGERWPIALIRRPADSGRARGSIVVNFGGPGASGVANLPGFADDLSPRLRRTFDLVSFDPRGVGASRPLRCNTNFDPVFAADPLSTQGAAQIVAGYKALAADCAARVGPRRLAQLGTNRVVADLDRIRAALGDRKLTYIGLSYGTRLGAVYANRYPGRVRALVLDGAMDPRADLRALGVELGRAWDEVLDRVLRLCTTKPACPLGPDPTVRWDELMARVRAEPLPAPGDPTGRRLTAGWLYQGTVALLVNAGSAPALWHVIADTLATGDGTMLLAAADAAVGRDTATGAYSNLNAVFAAVNCLDFPTRPTPDQIAGDALLAQTIAPRMGAAAVWTDEPLCLDWPVRAQPVPPATAAGAPPTLVIGTTGDPSTPYGWSQRLAMTLHGARLLTFDGIGHTTVGRIGGNGSACVDRWVERYLLTRRLPPAGTVC